MVNGFTTTPRLPALSQTGMSTPPGRTMGLQGASLFPGTGEMGGTLTDQGLYTLTNQEEVPAPLAGTQRLCNAFCLEPDESSEQMIVFPYPWTSVSDPGPAHPSSQPGSYKQGCFGRKDNLTRSQKPRAGNKCCKRTGEKGIHQRFPKRETESVRLFLKVLK